MNNFVSAYTTDRKIFYLRLKEIDNYELKRIAFSMAQDDDEIMVFH